MPDVTFRLGTMPPDLLRTALRDHAPRGKDIAWVGHVTYTSEFEPMTIVGLTPQAHTAFVRLLHQGGAKLFDGPPGPVSPGGESNPTALAHLAAPEAAAHTASGGTATTGSRRINVAGLHLSLQQLLVAAIAAVIVVVGIIKLIL